MLIDKYIFKTSFGRCYKVLLPENGVRPKGMKAKIFSDTENAKRFLYDLGLSTELLRTFASRIGVHPRNNSQPELFNSISVELVRAHILFVEVSTIDPIANPPSKRVLGGSGSVQYRFEPASTLLNNKPNETKNFLSVAAAKVFIDELGASDQELRDLIDAIGQSSATTVGAELDLVTVIAEKVAAGEIVIVVERPRKKGDESGGKEAPASTAETQPIELAPPTEEEVHSDWFELTLKDNDGNVIDEGVAAVKLTNNKEETIKLSGGSHKTDSNLPPGKCKVNSLLLGNESEAYIFESLS